MSVVPPGDSFDAQAEPAIARPPVVGYRTAHAMLQTMRPTALTVLAVVSLCVGVMGLLASGVVLTRAVPALFARTRPPPSVNAIPAPANLTPYAGEFDAPHGLPRGARCAVLAAVNAQVDLPVDRAEMLHRLLAEAGRQIFTGPHLTAGSAAGEIREVGQAPAGRDGLRTLGTHFLRTPAGVVLLDDTLARFHPLSPSGRVVQIEGFLVHDNQSGGPRLSAHDVEIEMDRLKGRFGDSLEPIPARLLADSIRKSSRWMRPRSGSDVPLPFDDVRILPSRAVEVRHSGWAWFMPDGRTIQNPAGLNAETGLPNSYAKGIGHLTRSIAWLVAADTVMAAAMNLFLITCGVLALVDSPQAGQRYAQWAWLRLALIVVVMIPVFDASIALGNGLVGAVASIDPVILSPVVASVLLLVRAAMAIVVLAVLAMTSVQAHINRLGGTTFPLREETQRAAWAQLSGMLGARVGRALSVLMILFLAVTSGAFLASAGTGDAWWSYRPTRVLLVFFAVLAIAAWAALSRWKREGAAS